jgi:hypothetical protein
MIGHCRTVPLTTHLFRKQERNQNDRMTTAESEARKALNRLRRAAEKAEVELRALRGSLERAEGADFPADDYEKVEAMLAQVTDFVDEEARRLQEKILHSGGLEPGRVRRGSS